METRSDQLWDNFQMALRKEMASNMLAGGKLALEDIASYAELPLPVVQGLMAQRAQAQPAVQ